MRIDQLAEVDFSKNWLICTRKGELSYAPKDPIWLRWVKTFIQVLTFGLVDVYGHVKIRHVARGLFAHFQKEPEKDNPLLKTKYIEVIDHLLDTKKNKHPVRRHRKFLIDVRKKINFSQV